MKERFADLHIHTYYSDSTMSPEDVVREAHAAGLSAIAIADHDTVDGLVPARVTAEPLGLEVIAGVELSSDLQGKDIHILGYMFDMAGSPLMKSLSGMQDARMVRMERMLEKLSALGVKDITYDEVRDQLKSDAVGRLHLAKLLVKKGHVRNLEEAFEKYLGEGAAAYFPKFKQSPFEAIKLIKDSGGLAVLAHPMLTARDELIPGLVKAGLDGIECFYPNCSMEIVNFYIGIAEKHDLLVTGGSDAHGKGKTSTYIGKAFVPEERVVAMKARLKR